MLDKVHSDWLSLASIGLRRRACILRSRSTLRESSARFLIRIWSVWIEMDWELIVAIIRSHHVVGACGRSKAERTASDRELNGSDQARRPV